MTEEGKEVGNEPRVAFKVKILTSQDNGDITNRKIPNQNLDTLNLR